MFAFCLLADFSAMLAPELTCPDLPAEAGIDPWGELDTDSRSSTPSCCSAGTVHSVKVAPVANKEEVSLPTRRVAGPACTFFQQCCYLAAATS